MDTLEKAVDFGEKLGADFVEARFEDLTLRSLQKINENWKDITAKTRSGIGVVCYYKGGSGYSFTASKSDKDIQEAVERAFKIAKASVPAVSIKLGFDNQPPVKSTGSDTFTVKEHPKHHSIDEKTELVNRAMDTAKEHGENISTITGLYGELYGTKLFTNSDRSIIDWEFRVVDLVCYVVSKTKEGNMVNSLERSGGTAGFELFSKEGSTPEDIGRKAGKGAKAQLVARACPAGQFRALVDNVLAGTLAHESFGHLSEADFIVTSSSPLTGKIGTKLGSEHATIADNGVPDIEKHGGIWLPFDDQGTRSGETTMLDKGTVTHYLHSRGTAKYLKQKPTGNCRAVHFGFMPIPRMTNTYFKPGDLTEEEALELLGTGVYAIESQGGQVQGDGSFLFKARSGYWVENGEKKYPLREVSLSGNILDLLGRVEGATKDFKIRGGYFGGCGKSGQYPLPTGLGGPKLVIDSVTFGGKA